MKPDISEIDFSKVHYPEDLFNQIIKVSGEDEFKAQEVIDELNKSIGKNKNKQRLLEFAIPLVKIYFAVEGHEYFETGLGDK